MPARINPPEVREQIRLLYLANGRNLSETARASGLPIDRLEKWKERGHWDASPEIPKTSLEQCRRVSDTVALTLAERRDSSRVNLSKYVVDASEKSARSKGDHKLARSTREVATIMEKVWPNEKEQNANTLVSVQILNER
jgi:hypothetical protein